MFNLLLLLFSKFNLIISKILDSLKIYYYYLSEINNNNIFSLTTVC